MTDHAIQNLDQLIAIHDKWQPIAKETKDMVHAKCITHMRSIYKLHNRPSERLKVKMMKTMHHFRFEHDRHTFYVAYKIIAEKVGFDLVQTYLIECKTAQGRVFHHPLDKRLGLFYSSHLFDRLLMRTADVADNRYQAIKFIMDEYLLSMLSLDILNVMIPIGDDFKMMTDENAKVRGMAMPNRYGICLGTWDSGILMVKTFIGEEMLRHKQQKLYDLVKNKMDILRSKVYDMKLLKELGQKHIDDEHRIVYRKQVNEHGKTIYKQG